MTNKEILALWDRAVLLWRVSDRACIDQTFSVADRDRLRIESVKAAHEAVDAFGGWMSGVDSPAAVALGWG